MKIILVCKVNSERVKDAYLKSFPVLSFEYLIIVVFASAFIYRFRRENKEIKMQYIKTNFKRK